MNNIDTLDVETLKSFIDERIDSGQLVPREPANFNAHYKAWRESRGLNKLGSRTINKAMEVLGYIVYIPLNS